MASPSTTRRWLVWEEEFCGGMRGIGVEISLIYFDPLPLQYSSIQKALKGSGVMLGVIRKIRMIPLTRERVLNTFKHKVRALRDSDSPGRLHKFPNI
jgi:hypothetical protein